MSHSMRAKWNTANARLANKPFENLFDDESRVCVRCGRPYTEANKKYTRLYGVMCVCGSQEWKDAEQCVHPTAAGGSAESNNSESGGG